MKNLPYCKFTVSEDFTNNVKLTKQWASGNLFPCILFLCVAILLTNSFEKHNLKLYLFFLSFQPTGEEILNTRGADHGRRNF